MNLKQPSFLGLIFLACQLLAFQAFAYPLTAAHLKNCKNIAVVAGTYDPFTVGHESLGRGILKELKYDCVLYLPTGNPPHKIASPLKSRYEMLEAALKDDPKLFYPEWDDLAISPKTLIDKLKTAGGTKREVFAVLGGDLSPKNYMYWINRFRLNPDGYIIAERGGEALEIAPAFKNRPIQILPPSETELDAPSSSKARKWFVENEHVYFKDGGIGSEFPEKIVRKEVAEYIAHNGLYYGSDGVTTRSPGRILTSAFKDGLIKLGLFEKMREIIVQKHKQDQLVDVIIDGKTYPLKKHLGSGLTADAYILNYEGEEWVVKIANQRPGSPNSIIQDVKIATYLDKKTSINIPELKAIAPDGKYKISKLIRGESLGDYITRNKGVLEPEIEKQLRQIVDDMLKLSATANTKLDLSVDNLKIWNNKIYLIDAGPIPPDSNHPMNFETFMQGWKRGAAGKVPLKQKCANLFKTLQLLTP